MMDASKNGWMHLLGVASILIILLSGILEIENLSGYFVGWGYVVGFLLTLISGKSRYTVFAILLSTTFILLSFFRYHQSESSGSVFIDLIYLSIGLTVTYLFLVIFLLKDRTTAKSNIQMAAIFEHGTQSILLSTSDGVIVLVNPFTENLFRYSPQELIGQNIKVLLPGLTIDPLSQSIVTKSFSRQDWNAQTKDGQDLTVEISCNQFETKKKAYVVSFVNDITSRKRSEEKLLDQKNELEIVNKEIEAFSYSVSHDLRAVGGYAQMLKEDYADIFDDEAKRLLKNIKVSAIRMGTLIDDLLTLSKLGRKELGKRWMEMEFLTRKALTDLNQSQKHNAIITIHPLHSALVDASLISQVMANLLSNAIKYSSKNKTPVIEVKSRIENDTIVYSVRDNGVGFDMKYAHKLFNIFERLHTDKEFEGTGIGLAIVKRIIQKHGGSIWAEGDIDKGATFYFSLPKTNHPPHPINGNNLQKSPTIRFEKEF